MKFTAFDSDAHRLLATILAHLSFCSSVYSSISLSRVHRSADITFGPYLDLRRARAPLPISPIAILPLEEALCVNHEEHLFARELRSDEPSQSLLRPLRLAPLVGAVL
jgi:hypothetical protein